MPVPESKTCAKCGETKPLSEYYKQADCRGGYRPDCKECVRGRIRENVDSRLATWAKRRVDPEYKRKAIARSRKHYRANLESIKAKKRAYNAANPDVGRRAWNKRRALKAGVEHEHYSRSEIFTRDGGHCRRCGTELHLEPHGFEIDHIVPLSLGGPDTPANVQLMCQPCNREKWNKLEGQIHLPV